MSTSCLSGILACRFRDDYLLVGGGAGPRGRASPNFGPEVGFNLVSGVRARPQIFSRVKLKVLAGFCGIFFSRERPYWAFPSPIVHMFLPKIKGVERFCPKQSPSSRTTNCELLV
jgi:hypothetical protein